MQKKKYLANIHTQAYGFTLTKPYATNIKYELISSFYSWFTFEYVKYSHTQTIAFTFTDTHTHNGHTKHQFWLICQQQQQKSCKKKKKIGKNDKREKKMIN